MKIEFRFIKPKYVHYAKRWGIDWITLSIRRKIMICPHEVRTNIILSILGYGFKVSIRNKYILEWQR